MNVHDHDGYFVARQRIIEQLNAWGYEPRNIAAADISEDGYYKFARDEHNNRMLDSTGWYLQRELVSWDDAEHYQWLVRTIYQAEGGK